MTKVLGRPMKYDWKLGRRLWIKGESAQAIADALGIPRLGRMHVNAAAARYGWPKRCVRRRYEVIR